jgi:hypothetical protein
MGKKRITLLPRLWVFFVDVSFGPDVGPLRHRRAQQQAESTLTVRTRV